MKIYADQAILALDYYFAGQGELKTFDPHTVQAQDLRDADILLVRSTLAVNAGLLSAASRLQWLGSCVTGVDHLDQAYLSSRRIPYYAAQGCNAAAVAEYVLSCIAALQSEAKLPKIGRAGVIGAGRVGGRVANLLKQLGYDVLTCDPLRQTDPNFTHTPLEQFHDLDLICVHTPLTKMGSFPTQNLLDRSFLQRQKPGCVLLNAGRGEVIHEADLWQYGRHLIWCLDVFGHEPNIDSRIVNQAFIATPHIAGHTVEAKIRGTHMVYQAAAQYFNWTETPIQVKLISWDAPDGNWQQQVLAYADPRHETRRFKQGLTDSQDFAKTFTEMRKMYLRHEFGFVSGLQGILSIGSD